MKTSEICNTHRQLYCCCSCLVLQQQTTTTTTTEQQQQNGLLHFIVGYLSRQAEKNFKFAIKNFWTLALPNGRGHAGSTAATTGTTTTARENSQRTLPGLMMLLCENTRSAAAVRHLKYVNAGLENSGRGRGREMSNDNRWVQKKMSWKNYQLRRDID